MKNTQLLPRFLLFFYSLGCLLQVFLMAALDGENSVWTTTIAVLISGNRAYDWHLWTILGIGVLFGSYELVCRSKCNRFFWTAIFCAFRAISTNNARYASGLSGDGAA